MSQAKDQHPHQLMIHVKDMQINKQHRSYTAESSWLVLVLYE